jgi:acyl carrier protein
MADDVREALRSFILSTFLPGEAPESLKDSTLLITSGVIASMSLLELVSFIEHAFSVTLQPDDMDRLDSVDLMADLIRQRRQGN